MEKEWKTFLAPYSQAVDELKVKLRGIRKQYLEENEHVPIEFVTGRVKPITSIVAKAELRNISMVNLETEMQDIAGLRIMCQFVEDIQDVLNLLKKRKDFVIVDEKDYIMHKKQSGYRSYHVVIEYPVQRIDGEKKILAEVQIRTLAMNFWATIEHSLNYKYEDSLPSTLNHRLERAAEAAFQLDEEMSQIRQEIKKAQHTFSFNKENQKKE